MKALWCAISLSILSVSLWAMPAQVMLIRHAETESIDSQNLSKSGYIRAASLVPLFMKEPYITHLQTPAGIYAQCPNKAHPSQWSIQTVKPLANALGVPLNAKFDDLHYDKMVRDIRLNPLYDGKLVVICWEHEDLASIARLFGVDLATEWTPSMCDKIWVIDFAGEKPQNFTEIPQKLLMGDSAL